MASYQFTAQQLQTAQQVLAAVPQATPEEQLALMEAGLVESGMRDLTYGDRDSEGVFQERPSQGWTNVTNVTLATQQMLAHFNTSLTDAGQMAQSGERSAYPDRYDAMEPEAAALLAQVKGGLPAGLLTSPIGGGQQNTSTGGAVLTSSNNSSVLGGFESWLDSVAVRTGLVMLGALFMIVGAYMAFKDTGAGKTIIAKMPTGNNEAEKE